jgi:hypothetical protein
MAAMQRTALLTQHGKLPFIAPALAAVGYGVILAEGLDTDTLGTFRAPGEAARRSEWAPQPRSHCRRRPVLARLGWLRSGRRALGAFEFPMRGFG